MKSFTIRVIDFQKEIGQSAYSDVLAKWLEIKVNIFQHNSLWFLAHCLEFDNIGMNQSM